MNGTLEKFCGGCQKTLPVGEFKVYLSGPRAGKALARCEACFRTESLAAQHRYLAADPKRAGEACARMKAYRAEHLEECRERERTAALRLRQKINLIKLERGCYDCGLLPTDPSILEFDHVSGEKIFGIGAKMKSFGLGATLREIDKCQVVCANCHRVRTSHRKLKGAE